MLPSISLHLNLNNTVNMSAKSLAVCIVAALAATVAEAAPSMRRSPYPMPASSIHSFSLQSWGPLEKDTNGDAVFVDAGLVSAEYIESINKMGKKTVCYIDAGTLESWRSDKEKFVISTGDQLAKKYKGFGGSEQWFDITKWEDIKAPMTARIQNAATKGCASVELDNTDVCIGEAITLHCPCMLPW